MKKQDSKQPKRSVKKVAERPLTEVSRKKLATVIGGTRVINPQNRI
jgi:hypothetical protein